MEPIHAQILRHPFVTGLTDGSLDPDAFRHYVLQDAHYLRDYAQALGLCSARATAETHILMFARHAAGAIAVERELHAGFLADWGVNPDALVAIPVAPTCRAYTSYLLAVCHGGSYAEAVAAVLPCYWIYVEVGRALLERGSPDPRYQRWISSRRSRPGAAPRCTPGRTPAGSAKRLLTPTARGPQTVASGAACFG